MFAVTFAFTIGQKTDRQAKRERERERERVRGLIYENHRGSSAERSQRLIGLSVSNNTARDKKTNYAITWKASTSIIDNTLASSQRTAGPPADSKVPNYLLRGNVYTLVRFLVRSLRLPSVMERFFRSVRCEIDSRVPLFPSTRFFIFFFRDLDDLYFFTSINIQRITWREFNQWMRRDVHSGLCF